MKILYCKMGARNILMQNEWGNNSSCIIIIYSIIEGIGSHDTEAVERKANFSYKDVHGIKMPQKLQ